MNELEVQANERKAQLKALREKLAKSKTSDVESNVETKKFKFRSYKPHSETLKEDVIPTIKPSKVDPHLEEHLAAAEDPSIKVENLKFENIMPRKPDWDLKRAAAPRLAKLQRRTQRAIAELIRERIQANDDAGSKLAACTGVEQETLDGNISD